MQPTDPFGQGSKACLAFRNYKIAIQVLRALVLALVSWVDESKTVRIEMTLSKDFIKA